MVDRRLQLAGEDGRRRCPWATGPWLTPYHDSEWGVPVHDDRRHFELLVLEGAQAGLSWLTVLRRREGYRRAFADFEPEEVARFDSRRVLALLADPGIIRNRQKVQSAVGNAAALLTVQAEQGSFDNYIWRFVGGGQLVNRWTSPDQVPAHTPLAAALSADLRRRGFSFVGPTVCYSYLQAAGLVLDHLTGCFRFEELAGPRG
ncbi:MAG TPA: DNA-3-methyladenine glycosylase I [Candidatus Dormibacteraeota bacterium]|nr:DNA-3-methyladenine glycosylase I [Candidatus Dormibacteraeota bacterium]